MSIFWIVFIALGAVLLVPLTIFCVVGGLGLAANVMARVLVRWNRGEACDADATAVVPKQTQTVETSE
jgi:hypothetical protein